MTKINIQQLKIEIQRLERHQILWKVLKEELGKLGHWKDKGRGKPFTGKD